MTGAAWPEFALAIREAYLARVPEEVARLGWDAQQVGDAQREALRELLAHAVEHSPFHARRLTGIDVEAIEPHDLSALPVMTKSDMMAEYDAVLTDPTLRRADIESALSATGTVPVLVSDRYVAMASGGSSGERGVFVSDQPAVVGFTSSLSRGLMARLQALGGPPPGGLQIAMVAAASPVHATGFASAMTAIGGWPFAFHSAPATLPFPDLVDRLNQLQPTALFGYPSMLSRLAGAQREGRLQLALLAVTSTSETLLPEVRDRITEAFGAPVGNTFGSTEGLVGTAAPGEDLLTFNSDRCIVELVDHDDQPVAPGTPSAKVLVTNLFNRVQPLVRYELTDSFTALPPAAEIGHLRARVVGRSEDVLRYGEVDVHPHVVRSVMVTSPDVTDYQVRQTPQGADIDVVTTGASVEVDDLAERISRALADAGLDPARVDVEVVDALHRHPETGKVRRFVPL